VVPDGSGARRRFVERKESQAPGPVRERCRDGARRSDGVARSACLLEHAGVALNGRAVLPVRIVRAGVRLPISLVAECVACPRGSGASLQAGDDPRGVAWCPGAPAFWSASCSEASQRRTIGAVARRRIERLRPRRWRAGGLPRGWKSCTGAVYRGGCPVSALCGACGSDGRASQAQCRTRHAPVGAKS